MTGDLELEIKIKGECTVLIQSQDLCECGRVQNSSFKNLMPMFSFILGFLKPTAGHNSTPNVW